MGHTFSGNTTVRLKGFLPMQETLTGIDAPPGASGKRLGVPAVHTRRLWERWAVLWKRVTIFVLNLIACVSFLLIVALLYKIVAGGSIVIEPISVPQVLTSNGYTPDVAARRLRDALEEYRDRAQTMMPSKTSQLQIEEPNFVVPTIGLSCEAIATFIRTFFRSTREQKFPASSRLVKSSLTCVCE